jgi:hypothetical protein
MMEFLYRLLLRLHPPEFRERFASEMTLNLEETEPKERSPRLLIDCFVSLLRQWLLRTAWWKLAAAAIFAYLQFFAIGLLWHVPLRFPRHAQGVVSATGEDGLRLVMLCASSFLVLLATVTALWVRSLVAARQKASRRRRFSVMS